MRKIYLVLLAVCFAVGVNAQSMSNYAGANFAATSGTFTPLSGGTTVSSLLASDDNISTNLPIGFTFYYLGKAYTQFRAGSDGFITLYTAGGTYAFIANNLVSGAPGTERPVIAPFWDDMDGSASGGVASYLTSGSVGSRVLTFEWLNWARTLGATPVMSFQVKLFESTGIIQFVYRSDAGTLTSGSASIGLSGVSTGSGNYVSLSGAGASPTTSTTSETSTISAKPATGQTYTFTPPQAAVTTPSAGVTFTGTTAGGMTLNWTDGSTNETGFNIFRSTDNINFTWVATVTSTSVAGTATPYTSAQSGLSANTLYYWQVVANSEGVPSTAVTGSNSTLAAQTYHWIGTGTTPWATASNWSPARNTPDVTDILIIDNNGGASTTSVATGFTSQTVARLSVTNGCSIAIQASATASLTITSDGTSTDELSIATGATLLNNGSAAALTLTFTSGSTANIAGTLEINNTTPVNALTLTNCIMTVPSGGKLAAGGTVTTSPWTGVSATTLLMTGIYEHKYTTVAGTIPTALWNTNSTCLVSGYTSNTTAPSGTVQTFYNFTWNCPSQAGNINLTGSVPSANGTFTMTSTGAGANELRLSGTTAYTVTWANYAQTGGIVDLANGASGADVINLTTTFNQSAGTFKCTGTGTTNITLNFNGASAQNVTFTGQPAGPIIYRISNTAGITLNANIASFAIGNGTLGGIRVTAAVATPITLGGSITALVYNAANSTLTYDASTGIQTTTSTEFPATGAPANLIINNTSIAGSLNRVNLHAARTLAGTLTMTSGVLQLSNFNLTMASTGTVSGTASNTNFIATNGTGQLIQTYAATGSKTFPLGDVTGTDEASAVTVNYTALTGTSVVGVRVTDGQHPNDASGTDYLSRYYSFTQSGATAGTYTLTLNYQSGDVAGTVGSTRVNRWDGVAWTKVSGAVPGATSVVATSLNYTNLNATADFTLRPNAVATYTWKGGASGSYATPANWTPTRSAVDGSDILQFDGSNIDGVGGTGNIVANALPATETIGKLILLNNANVNLQASANSSALTIGGAAGTDLDVPSGSTLTLSGTTTNTIGLAYSGSGNVASIAGTLNLGSGAGTGVITYAFGNAVTTVGGTVNAGTSTATATVSSATTTTLLVNGTWNHNMNGGTLPTATYALTSNLNVNGIVATAPNAPGTGIVGGNFTWNSTGQTGAALSLSSVLTSIGGTCTIQSTGTGSMQFGTSPTLAVAGLTTISGGTLLAAGGALTFNGGLSISGGTISGTGATILNVNGNFSQSGASTITSSTTTASVIILNVTGSFTQSAGTISETSTGSIAINFTGSAVKAVTMSGTNTTGIINYTINNGNGNGLSLTGTLNINSGATLTSSVGGTAISGGAVTYTGTSTLRYNCTTAAQTATAVEFPAASGPANLTVAVGAGNVLSLPFNRSLSPAGVNGILNMTSGDIDLGANTLTLGTSVAFPGTLTYTAGLIRITSGSLTRWFPITGLPTTTGGTGIGFYPLAFGPNNRAANIYFSTSTALSAGGTITASHTDASGVTAVSFLDGAAPIDKITNTSWTFAQSGITATGTISVRLSGGGISALAGVSIATTALRMVQSAAAAGTFVASSYGAPNFRVDRTGLTVGNLATTHYIGGSNADIPTIYTAIASADWSLGTTWDQGSAPGAGNIAVIPTGINVTTDGAAANVCNSLVINSGGTVTSATASLAIGTSLTNSGTVTISGGSVTTTTSVTNNTGAAINVSSGSLNITTTLTNAGTLTASGGTTSVTASSGTGITNSGTLTVSGGTVSLSSAGANNRTFTNSSGGSLTISSGNLNVFGNVVISNNSNLTMSGGTFTEDGNNAGSTTNSVATGTALFTIGTFGTNYSTGTVSLTGGSIVIVDPHTGADDEDWAFVYYGLAAPANNITPGPGFNLQFGDGVSSDAGGSVVGFYYNQWEGSAGFKTNIVLNSGSGTNRTFNSTYTPMAVGNVTVQSGEFRTTTNTIIQGNLTVNAPGIYTSNTTTQFAAGTFDPSITIVTSANTAAQTISGNGTFRNATVSPTAGFTGVTINNSNAAGVSLSGTDMSLSGTLTFTLGKVNTSSNKVILIAGAGTSGAGQSTGFVNGNLQRNFATGSSVSRVFDIGSNNNYSPATVNFASVSTGGNLTVSTTGGDHPGLAGSGLTINKTVNRYWTATNAGIVFTNYALTLGWQSADNDGGITAANFKVGKFNSPSAWTLPAIAGTPTATSITTTNSITGFSDFAVAEVCATPTITLAPASTTLCEGETLANLNYSGTTESPDEYSIDYADGSITDVTNAALTGSPIALTLPGSLIPGAYTGDLTVRNSATGCTSAVYTITVNVYAISDAPVVNALCANSTAIDGTSSEADGTVITVYVNGTSIGVPTVTGGQWSLPATVVAGDQVEATAQATGECLSVASAVVTVANVGDAPVVTSPICDGASSVSGTSTEADGTTVNVFVNGNPVGTAIVATGAWTATGLTLATGEIVTATTAPAGECESVSSNSVTVSDLPTAIIDADNGPLCSGGDAEFILSGTSGATVTYTINNGSPQTISLTGGTATITLTGVTSNQTLDLVSVTTGACSQLLSGSSTITVNAPPTATAGGSETICETGSYTLLGSEASATNGTILWTHNGAGSLADATTLTPTYTATAGDAGNTVTLTLTVSNGSCTDATDTYTIIVQGIPTASAGGNVSICETGSYTLSGGEATATNGSILWTHSGSGSLTDETTLTPTYTAAAGDAGSTVTLTLTVSNGSCTDATATYTVDVSASPTASAGGSTTICETGSYTLIGGDAAATNGTMLWTHDGSGSLSDETTLTPTYTAAAGDAGNTVTLTLTVSNSPCTDATTTYAIIVKGIPTASAGGSATICETGSYTLSGGEASATNGSILWTHSGSGSLSDETTLTPTYTAAAGDAGNTVTLTLTVSNGACTDATASYSVIVKATTTINTQPLATQTVCENAVPTTLSVGASGSRQATVNTTNAIGGLTYQWYENTVDDNTSGTLISGETATTYIPPTTTPGTTYYYVVVTGLCGTVTSNTAEVIVSASNTPTVSIAAVPSGAICAGTPVTFTATAGGTGGGIVTYDFKVDGSIVQSTSSNSYVTSVLANGNIVTCDITVSGGSCMTTTTATSNAITMTVNANNTPTVSIAAVPSGSICAGTSVTFTATAGSTGGGTVNYNFKVNGSSVQSGASNTFTTSALINGNTVTCEITVTGGTCMLATTATSNTITMAVIATSTPTVSIAAFPGTSICAGTSVTFIASAGSTAGGTVNYDFKVNGSSVQSSASNSYTTVALIDGDNVTCEITVSGGTCLTANTASSNTLTMTVYANNTPTVSIGASPGTTICAGTSVTFTATASNTGFGIVNYNFKVNGSSVQSGASNTYITSALANGNTVSCDISISGGICMLATTASSNTLTMTVNASNTPTVSIAAVPSGPICPGTSVTFTATAGGAGGGTVSYDFKVNGISVQTGASNTYTTTGLANGNTVECEITVTGGSCMTATTASSNIITMVVNGPATANAGGNQTVCAGSTVTLSGSVGGSATGGTWSGGAGTFSPNATTLNAVYTPTSLEVTAGTVTLTLTTSGGCTSANANMTVTFTTSSIFLAGSPGGGQVCRNMNVGTGAMYSDNSCNPMARIVPNGANPISGMVNVCVTIDASVQSFMGEAYVQRHFDITPQVNQQPTGTARVTLFVDQFEFNAYNAANGAEPDLPTGPGDGAGIINLRVAKYSGNGTAPGNYSPGLLTLINPVDADIVWNATTGWWEISFDVSGFSGFFVKTGSSVVPVNLISFSGYKSGNSNKLQWITSSESNNVGFDVQRSLDGVNYTSIGFVNTLAPGGNSVTNLNYNFTDNSITGNRQFYRLRQIDIDSRSRFSNIVLIKGDKPVTLRIDGLFPNPASSVVNILIAAPGKDKVTVMITDLAGRAVVQRLVNVDTGSNTIPVAIDHLSNGTYMVKLICSNNCETAVGKFVKQ